MTPLTWGIHFVPTGGAGLLLEAGAQLAKAGVGEISLSDEAFGTEPLTVLAAIAAREPSLRVAVRVTNPYVRHPLTLAREARVVGEVAERGFVLGLGVGGAMSLQSTGMMARRRIAGMAACLDAVRRLLAGERVTMETPDFALDGHLEGDPLPAGRVQFEMTGRGPKMLAASAALADSVLVVGSGFEEGAGTIAAIREAARAAGRTIMPRITWSTYAVPDETLLDDLAPYMAYGLAEPTTIDRGVAPEIIAQIRETLHRDGRVAAGKLVPREYIATRVPVGSVEQCRQTLTRWAAEQEISTILLRIPDSPHRERWMSAACAVATA